MNHKLKILALVGLLSLPASIMASNPFLDSEPNQEFELSCDAVTKDNADSQVLEFCSGFKDEVVKNPEAIGLPVQTDDVADSYYRRGGFVHRTPSGYLYGAHYGYHYGNHSGYHYGAHSGVHYSPTSGWHSGYHYGPHSGYHYGSHGGSHYGYYSVSSHNAYSCYSNNYGYGYAYGNHWGNGNYYGGYYWH